MSRPRLRKDDDRFIHIRMSADMHRRLRVRAAELDVSIQEWVHDLVEEALKTRKGKR